MKPCAFRRCSGSGRTRASPYAKQPIAARRDSLASPTLVVLENQEHNGMDKGRDILADTITKFAAAPEKVD